MVQSRLPSHETARHDRHPLFPPRAQRARDPTGAPWPHGRARHRPCGRPRAGCGPRACARRASAPRPADPQPRKRGAHHRPAVADAWCCDETGPADVDGNRRPAAARVVEHPRAAACRSAYDAAQAAQDRAGGQLRSRFPTSLQGLRHAAPGGGLDWAGASRHRRGRHGAGHQDPVSRRARGHRQRSRQRRRADPLERDGPGGARPRPAHGRGAPATPRRGGLRPRRRLHGPFRQRFSTATTASSCRAIGQTFRQAVLSR